MDQKLITATIWVCLVLLLIMLCIGTDGATAGYLRNRKYGYRRKFSGTSPRMRYWRNPFRQHPIEMATISRKDLRPASYFEYGPSYGFRDSMMDYDPIHGHNEFPLYNNHLQPEMAPSSYPTYYNQHSENPYTNYENELLSDEHEFSPRKPMMSSSNNWGILNDVHLNMVNHHPQPQQSDHFYDSYYSEADAEYNDPLSTNFYQEDQEYNLRPYPSIPSFNSPHSVGLNSPSDLHDEIAEYIKKDIQKMPSNDKDFKTFQSQLSNFFVGDFSPNPQQAPKFRTPGDTFDTSETKMHKVVPIPLTAASAVLASAANPYRVASYNFKNRRPPPLHFPPSLEQVLVCEKCDKTLGSRDQLYLDLKLNSHLTPNEKLIFAKQFGFVPLKAVLMNKMNPYRLKMNQNYKRQNFKMNNAMKKEEYSRILNSALAQSRVPAFGGRISNKHPNSKFNNNNNIYANNRVTSLWNNAQPLTQPLPNLTSLKSPPTPSPHRLALPTDLTSAPSSSSSNSVLPPPSLSSPMQRQIFHYLYHNNNNNNDNIKDIGFLTAKIPNKNNTSSNMANIHRNIQQQQQPNILLLNNNAKHINQTANKFDLNNDNREHHYRHQLQLQQNSMLLNGDRKKSFFDIEEPNSTKYSKLKRLQLLHKKNMMLKNMYYYPNNDNIKNENNPYNHNKMMTMQTIRNNLKYSHSRPHHSHPSQLLLEHLRHNSQSIRRRPPMPADPLAMASSSTSSMKIPAQQIPAPSKLTSSSSSSSSFDSLSTASSAISLANSSSTTKHLLSQNQNDNKNSLNNGNRIVTTATRSPTTNVYINNHDNSNDANHINHNHTIIKNLDDDAKKIVSQNFSVQASLKTTVSPSSSALSRHVSMKKKKLYSPIYRKSYPKRLQWNNRHSTDLTSSSNLREIPMLFKALESKRIATTVATAAPTNVPSSIQYDLMSNTASIQAEAESRISESISATTPAESSS